MRNTEMIPLLSTHIVPDAGACKDHNCCGCQLVAARGQLLFPPLVFDIVTLAQTSLSEILNYHSTLKIRRSAYLRKP